MRVPGQVQRDSGGMQRPQIDFTILENACSCRVCKLSDAYLEKPLELRTFEKWKQLKMFDYCNWPGEFEQHPGITVLDVQEHQLDIAAKRLPCGFAGSLIYPVHHTILVLESKQKASDPKTCLGRLK